MTDRPIIFSAPMVRALLDGRKTQTRRIYKVPAGSYVEQGRVWAMTDGCAHGDAALPYAPGDRLYVREAHALVPSTAYRMSPGVPYAVNDEDGSQACVYREGWERSKPGQWRPSIHMPRWASRLTLTVTEIRVQRLQDISEADAVAEGIERLKSGRGFYDPTVSKAAVRFGEWTSTAKQGFSRLWNSLHGPEAWDANPWVVAVSFTVEQRNIDGVQP